MVNEFRSIFVPFDNSKNSMRTLNKAVSIANVTNAKITLVHVISYHKAIAKIVSPYKGTLINHVKKFMGEASTNATRRINVRIEKKILYGSIIEEILKLMKKKKFDMVVVGKRGTSKLTGPSLGSVSNALTQSSKIPILIVQ